MRNILVGLLLWACCGSALAGEWRLLDAREVSVEFWHVENQRDAYLRFNDPGSDTFGETETWKYGAAMNLNVDLVRFPTRQPWGIYWNNHVHMDATEAAVRHAGWLYEFGLHAGQYLDVFVRHHSRHVLDQTRDDKFPLMNYVGARLIVLRR